MQNYYEKEWKALKEEIDRRGGDGAAFVEAMQDFYTVYDDKFLVWLAKLYDPDVGGFYYSNSGRDNEEIYHKGEYYKFLPDIESTYQAVDFLRGEKIIEKYTDLPKKMLDQMYNFCSGCLDPESGFFYHPQWPKEFTDKYPSRRGRDLGWAENLQVRCGWKYPYPTAYERLSGEVEEDNATSAIPDYMSDKEKLLEYLKSLDFENEPYVAGNELSAQGSILRSAGLIDFALDYLDSIQDPETGMWGKNISPSHAVNGHMKISLIYANAKRIIPNAEKAVKVIVSVLLSMDPPPGSVCFQYNCWSSLGSVISSLKKIDTDEGRQKLEEVRSYLLKIAPEAIRMTKEKVLLFRKPDYSFSYMPDMTSYTSQGMPVAIPYTDEGDINAATICAFSTTMSLFGTLEIKDFYISQFSPNAYNVFVDNLRGVK